MKYKAFLSYKHPDEAWEMEFVKRFEASLKNYAKPFLTPPIKIFRDEVSLSPGADLNQMIRGALAESEYLILLASKDASKSTWVDAEIKVWFEDLKRTDEKLIVVVLDGQIDMNSNQEIDWAQTTCLPKSAETYLKTIPLWIDFRELAQVEDIDLGHPVFKAGINGIVARFRDLNPEAMIGQEILQHRRNRQIAYGVGAALGLLLIATVSFATISVFERQQAALAQAQSLSRQLAAQSVFSRRHQADQLTRSALLAAESVRVWPTLQGSDALLAAVSLLRPELHHVDHAAPVLGLSFDATGKYLASVSASSDGGSIKIMDTESYDLVFEREHHTGISLVEFSPSSELFVVAGWSNNVQAFETETGALKFEIARNQNEGTSRIESVAFSQDGNLLAVGAGDEITLHSASTGQRITSLSLDGLVEHFEFSHSSEQLIAASGDSATIWSLTDNPASVVLPHENSVNSVSLGPNGRFAASGDIDGVIKLWDLESNSVHGQWQLEEEVVEVKFSPNGWWLGAATGDPFSFSGQVKVWSVDDLIDRGSKRHQGPVTAIEFSPDSRSIASSSLDNTARIWDVFSAHELARMTHENALISLAISPRGHFLATGAHDHRAKLWTIKDAALLRLPHASEVTAVAISNDGKFISTGSQGLGIPGFNGLVRIWETETGKLLFGKSYESGVAKVAFNSKGTEIAAVSEGGGSVLVWGVPSGDLVAKFEHAEDVIDFAFLPGSDAVVTIDGSGLLSLWMRNGEQPEYVQPTGNSGSHIELSNDGRWIAYLENNFVRILHASTGEEIGRIDLKNAAQFARFSPDGARLAVIETPGTLSIWQTSDWRRLSTVKTDDTIVEVLFSADGRRVVTRSDHEQVLANIWRVDPLERMSALPHDAPVMSIDVSHKGQWVATSSVDNTARVWDIETGEELARMDFDHLVADVAFSDDGHRIVAGSHDKSAISWRWQSMELIASACERLPRNLTAEEWRHFLPDQEYNATCPLP